MAFVHVVDQIKDAAGDIAKKNGMTLKISKATYGAADVRLVIEIESLDKEKIGKERWESYCRSFGLKPEHYGATIRMGSAFYKIVGFDLNRHKNPIVIESAKGKRYVCSPAATGLVEAR